MKTLLPLSLLVKPDKNDPDPLVIYHGRNCPDGFAAALAAWFFYEGRAEFLGLDHGDVHSLDDLPALAGRAVLIGTATDPLELQRVHPAGRTAMDAGSWWRGRSADASTVAS